MYEQKAKQHCEYYFSMNKNVRVIMYFSKKKQKKSDPLNIYTGKTASPE